MVTLYTFGDSILDCGRYNEFGVHPGQLLVQNNAHAERSALRRTAPRGTQGTALGAIAHKEDSRRVQERCRNYDNGNCCGNIF